MGIQDIKKIVELTPNNVTTDNFINIHKATESYIRRLFLIGLRVNGVSYKVALQVIKGSYLNNKVLIEKTIKLITKGTKEISDFENSNNDLKILKELFFEFTSIYRNRVIHGIYKTVNDQTILNHCYYINKYFIIEFEQTLLLLHYKSAYDTPSDWGAIRDTSTESFDQVVRRLNLGQLVKPPKGIIAVKNQISKTKYNNQI